MTFERAESDVWVGTGEGLEAALARTTHLGIGAHPDDLEFFGYHGIEACFGREGRWFSGVTCTTGSGCARGGPYAGVSDEEMVRIRIAEQRKAAEVGGYAAMVQLGHPSAAFVGAEAAGPRKELEWIVGVARPEVVYLHNPADKHDTHVAVLMRSLEALRALPAEARPREVWGCEVWRGLDWVVDGEKTGLATDARPNLEAALCGVFDSQISGGKRYDRAVVGRRRANATFHEALALDACEGLTWALDLKPLLEDGTGDVVGFVEGLVERLKADVVERVRRVG